MKLKKLAGRAKWWAQCNIDPRTLWHRFRSEAYQAKASDWQGQIPVVETPAEGDAELHMQCCSSHVGMACWALYSFLRYESCRMPVVIHDDGTLTDEDVQRIRAVVPQARFIMRTDADAHWERVVPEYGSLVSAARRRCRYGIKLLDTHLHARSKAVVLMDTDVLFFEEPKALLDEIRDVASGQTFCCTWDAVPGLVAPAVELESRLGHAVEPRMCAGMLVVRRFDSEVWRQVEEQLSKFDDEWLDHYWLEQTVYAAMAGAKGVSVLDLSYNVGRKQPHKMVACHYVGVPTIRPRFYTQGIPRIKSQMA